MDRSKIAHGARKSVFNSLRARDCLETYSIYIYSNIPVTETIHYINKIFYTYFSFIVHNILYIRVYYEHRELFENQSDAVCTQQFVPVRYVRRTNYDHPRVQGLPTVYYYIPILLVFNLLRSVKTSLRKRCAVSIFILVLCRIGIYSYFHD